MPGKVFPLVDIISKLVARGYPAACGVSDDAYRALWPTSVEQPPEYAGRFNEPLLVDNSLPFSIASELNGLDDLDLAERDRSTAQRLVPVPVHPESGEVLTRYVAWIQSGRKYLRWSIPSVRRHYAEDEVGLVIEEGVHLPGQFERVLRARAMDLPGTAYLHNKFPSIVWFGQVRPHFLDCDLAWSAETFGAAITRGSKVIPVSWAS